MPCFLFRCLLVGRCSFVSIHLTSCSSCVLCSVFVGVSRVVFFHFYSSSRLYFLSVAFVVFSHCISYYVYYVGYYHFSLACRSSLFCLIQPFPSHFLFLFPGLGLPFPGVFCHSVKDRCLVTHPSRFPLR